MNSTVNKATYTLLFKPKQQHKSEKARRKTNSREKNETTGGKRGHRRQHDRVCHTTWSCVPDNTAMPLRPWAALKHHVQPVAVAVIGVLHFSNAAFCASFWFAGSALDLLSWAYWASFETSLDLGWP